MKLETVITYTHVRRLNQDLRISFFSIFRNSFVSHEISKIGSRKDKLTQNPPFFICNCINYFGDYNLIIQEFFLGGGSPLMWKVLASGLFRYRMGCFLFIAATCPDLLGGQSIFLYFFQRLRGYPSKITPLILIITIFIVPLGARAPLVSSVIMFQNGPVM